MKANLCLLAFYLSASSLAPAQTVVQDTFSDGHRDKALWAVAPSTSSARLVEHDGRLYADSGVVTFFGNHDRRWQFQTPVRVRYGQTIDFEADIKLGASLNLGADPDAWAGLNIGFMSKNQAYETQTSISSWEGVIPISGWVDTNATSLFFLPVSSSRFSMKLSYSTVTGKVRFYARAKGADWTKFGSKDMNVGWNVPMGHAVALIPFIGFTDSLTWIAPGSPIFFDTVKLTVR